MDPLSSYDTSVHIPTAAEMREAGKRDALTDAIVTISQHAVAGDVLLPKYSEAIKDHVTKALRAAGYVVEDELGGYLRVFWSEPST